jgi:hypothetical protein
VACERENERWTQRPKGLPERKPDLRAGKRQKKLSKRLGGK